MSAYSTTVAVEVLRDKAKKLDYVASAYASSVASLYRLTDDLNRMWDGGASRAFQTQFNSQKDLFEKGSRTLKDYTQALRDTADAYARAEEQAISIIGS